MLKLLLLFILSVIYLSIVQTSYAVSLTITNPPSVITTDSVNLSVTVSGASAGVNYLRVDLYKEGTTNYFGQTYNGTDWYEGADGTQYLPITIGSDKTWSGTIQARIGDTMPKDYDGTGTYDLRVRRYTAGGNYNNDEAKASAVVVALSFPTATPTPFDTPTMTPAPSPTKIPTPTLVPTATKIPTPTKVPTPIKSSPTPTKTFPTIKPTQFVIKIPTILPTKATASMVTRTVSPTQKASSGAMKVSILGANTSTMPTVIVTKRPAVLVADSRESKLPLLLFTIAGGLFIACGILIYRWKLKQEA